uniref:30S ribosomal protein S10 n=1 Tax=Gimesia benthica TaxID=2608982 RepID=UPI0036F1B45E
MRPAPQVNQPVTLKQAATFCHQTSRQRRLQVSGSAGLPARLELRTVPESPDFPWHQEQPRVEWEIRFHSRSAARDSRYGFSEPAHCR